MSQFPGADQQAAADQQCQQRAFACDLHRFDDDLVFRAARKGGELAGRDHLPVRGGAAEIAQRVAALGPARLGRLPPGEGVEMRPARAAVPNLVNPLEYRLDRWIAAGEVPQLL